MFTVRHYSLFPDLYYDPEKHLWIKVAGKQARIGIDPLEAETRGGFVVIQISPPGTRLQRGDAFATVEAEKHVGTLQAPVSGTVVAINQALLKNPRLANTDPYGEGWFVEVELHQFDREKSQLITGEPALREWFEKEIRKYEEWGWLAES